jgi:O-antigen/teichoic acid export membrane protein
MSLKRQAIRGGALLAVRQCVGMVVGFGSLLYVSKVIGPAAFGIFSATYAIYQYALILCQCGLNVYLIRLQDNNMDRQFHQVFWLLGVIGLLGFFGAVVAMLLWPASSTVELTLFPLLVFLGLPLDLLASVPLAKLEREMEYKPVALIEFAGGLANQLGSLLAAQSGLGIWSLVLGLWLQVLIRFGGYLRYSHYRPRWLWDWSLVRMSLRSGIAFSGSGWVWQLRTLVNPVVIGHSLGVEAVGSVALAIRFVDTLSFVRTAIWRLSFAALAKVQNDKDRLVRAINQGMWLQMVAVGLPLAVFAWVGPWFVSFYLGHEWDATLAVFPYIAFATLVNTGMGLHASALYARGRNWHVMICSTVLVVSFAVAAAVMVPNLGLNGYIAAELIAMPAYMVLHRFVVSEVGPVNYRPAGWWLAAVGSLLFVEQLGVLTMLGPLLLALRKETYSELRQLVDALRNRTQSG